jgi:hypothetical protein
MFNFPDAPAHGERYQPAGAPAYIWDGVKWSTSSAQWTGALPSDSNPAMDDVASAGSSSQYARGDHRHPTDATRAPINNTTFTGTVTATLLSVSGNITINGKVTSTAKGHRFGTHGGNSAGGAVTRDDAHLLFYNHTAGSWSGFGVDNSGNVWLRTGYAEGLAPIFYIRNDQVMAFRDTPLAPTPGAGDNSQKIATTSFVKNRSGSGSYVPLAGGTVWGNLTHAAVDLWVHNNGNYGVIYLGNSGARYLQWDGGTYNFSGASVYGGGQGRIWGTGDFGGAMPYNNARLAYVADRAHTGGLEEPYGGSTITGSDGPASPRSPITIRYRQFQYYHNSWFAIGYA